MFRRVRLSLGVQPTGNPPTDERLKRVQQGATDLALEALYFDFGRYLLISSSRPGALAATLQGKWNDKLAPSWDSKYTININTEMNYWPAEVCNLSELHEPLFDLIEKTREDGRRVAKNLYGGRGFVAITHGHRGHGAHRWRVTALAHGRGVVVPAPGEHYDFTRRQFLGPRLSH